MRSLSNFLSLILPLTLVLCGSIVQSSHAASLPLRAQRKAPHAVSESPAAELGAAWTRSYALLLDGDEKWLRFLKGTPEALEALRLDARNYRNLLATGEVISRLNNLAALPLPQEEGDWIAALSELRDLMDSCREEQDVKARSSDLREYARICLSETVGDRTPFEGLHGHVEHLGEGRIKLSYDFNTEGQFKDFEVRPDWRKAEHERWFQTSIADEDSYIRIEDGRIRALGQTAALLTVDFEPPMALHYTLRFELTSKYLTPTASMQIGMCDEGEAGQIVGWDAGDLEVIDRASGVFLRARGEGTVETGRDYQLGLRHDINTVSTWLEGKRMKELKSGGRMQGAISIYMHGGYPISLDNLVIEGKVSEKWRAQRIERWIDAELDAMGLGE